MTQNDYEKFKSAWVNAHAISANGKQLNDGVISFAFEILYEYPLEKILGALVNHAKKQKFAPTPNDVIEILSAQSPKHLGPEEAWAIALRSFDETLPIVLTNQILAAKAASQDVFDSGDKIGARMAFREVYSRLLLTAGEPQWFLSMGDNKGLTADVVQEAVRLGRLPAEALAKYHGIAPPTITAQALIGRFKQRSEVVPAGLH